MAAACPHHLLGAFACHASLQKRAEASYFAVNTQDKPFKYSVPPVFFLGEERVRINFSPLKFDIIYCLCQFPVN
jgi:hypothetical protein